jgi:hypothetical protein
VPARQPAWPQTFGLLLGHATWARVLDCDMLLVAIQLAPARQPAWSQTFGLLLGHAAWTRVLHTHTLLVCVARLSLQAKVLSDFSRSEKH